MDATHSAEPSTAPEIVHTNIGVGATIAVAQTVVLSRMAEVTITRSRGDSAATAEQTG